MRNPGADTLFILSVTILITLVLTTSATGESIDLLDIGSQQVVSNNRSFEWLYTDPQDDDCNFTAPAQQFEEAELKENVAVTQYGGLTIEAAEDGSFATEGTFISPIISGPLFTDVQFAYTGTIPQGTAIILYVKPIFLSGRQGEWMVVDPNQDIHFDDKVSQFQYQLVLRSHDGEKAPTVKEVSIFSEESKYHAPVPAPNPNPNQNQTNLACPPIIEREQWGGRAATKNIGRTGTVDTIIVHHTAGSAARYKGARTMQGIQNFHQNTRGWADIGYHYVIGPDGKIFRGRPEETLGAHAPPNRGRIGISVIGNYENETLSPQAKEAMNQLVAHLCGKHGLSSGNILEHGQVGNTACPGRDVKNYMPELKSHADRATQAGSPTD